MLQDSRQMPFARDCKCDTLKIQLNANGGITVAENKWTCTIDKDLRPAYYDSFKCLMGDCRMSCCKGWRITFDKNDYQKLKKSARSSPELTSRLEHGLHRLREKNAAHGHYAEMRLDGKGWCPLLTESGLCALQLEAGEKALPEVCKIYPRREEARLSGYWERALSPSCEAVLHQLWQLPEGVDFRSDPLPKEKWLKRDAEEFSYLTPWFQDIRAVCIDLLQDRSIPLNQRILLMGLRLQMLMDESVDIPRWIAETEALMTAEKPSLQSLLRLDSTALCMNLSNNIRLLFGAEMSAFVGIKGALLATLGMEKKKDDRSCYVGMKLEGEDILIAPETPADLPSYQKMRKEFEQTFAQQEYFFENLAVSIFFYLGYPKVSSPEDLWRSYVNFCQIWSFYHFLSVLSVRVQLPPLRDRPEEVPLCPGSQDALFHLLISAGRTLLHSLTYTDRLLKNLFENDSVTLAHMAILLGG